jgi:hypothetical protein
MSKHTRTQPPATLKTTEIAMIFRICTRAVYDVQCISPHHVENLQCKLEWLHAKHVPLDLQGLCSARADVFKEEIGKVVFSADVHGYSGPILRFALEPMLIEAPHGGRTEPAQYLERALNLPYGDHGQLPWSWSMLAAEGCMQVFASHSELVHSLNNMDEDHKAEMVKVMRDVIMQAAVQEGLLNFTTAKK